MTYKRSILATVVLSVSALAFASGYLISRARAAGAPQMSPLTYSGVLTDTSGVALTGSKNVLLQIYSVATAGTTLCGSAPVAVTLVGGAFSVPLGDACTAVVRANPDLWIDVLIDGASVGRTKLGAVPYSIESDHAVTATRATNADIAATANAAGGTLATAISTLDASVTALTGRFDLHVFAKPGNNGSVSCDTFCAGSQWGTVGTCVGANLTGVYIACATNPGVTNASVGICWCSAPK